MMGCSVYSSASLFLLIAVASYRLDNLEEAEDALQEVRTHIQLIRNIIYDIMHYIV